MLDTRNTSVSKSHRRSCLQGVYSTENIEKSQQVMHNYLLWWRSWRKGAWCQDTKKGCDQTWESDRDPENWVINLRSEESVGINKTWVGRTALQAEGKACTETPVEGTWCVCDQWEESGTNLAEEGDQSHTMLGFTEQIENWGLYSKNHRKPLKSFGRKVMSSVFVWDVSSWLPRGRRGWWRGSDKEGLMRSLFVYTCWEMAAASGE